MASSRNPRRRPSWAKRVKSLFTRTRQPKLKQQSRLVCAGLMEDFDEAPQRHMAEIQRQMVRVMTSRSPVSQQRQGASTSSTRTSAAVAGTGCKRSATPAASVKRTSPGAKQDVRLPSGSPARPTAITTASDKNSATETTCTLNQLLPLSPLEVFYNSYVAPYDNRLPRQAAQGELKLAQTRRGATGFVKQLCAKKSSRDNTIGSIDSISSEVGITGGDDDGLTIDDEIGAKEMLFIADTARRVGKDSDTKLKLNERKVSEGRTENLRHHVTPREACLAGAPGSLAKSINTKVRHPFASESPERPKTNRDSYHSPRSIAAEGFTEEEEEESDAGEANVGFNGADTQDLRADSPHTVGSGGESTPTDDHTLTPNERDESSIELPPPPRRAGAGLTVDAQVDSALVNVRKTRDSVSVSGRYSQVVLLHGSEQSCSGSSKAATVSESPTGVEPTAAAEDLVGTSFGRHNVSFNICGENIYINVGGKKTRIKGCRKKKKVVHCEPGPAADVDGPSGMGNVGGVSGVKKKKLKKKLKKSSGNKGNVGLGAAGSKVKKTKKLLKRRVLSSTTYTKIAKESDSKTSDWENAECKKLNNTQGISDDRQSVVHKDNKDTYNELSDEQPEPQDGGSSTLACPKDLVKQEQGHGRQHKCSGDCSLTNGSRALTPTPDDISSDTPCPRLNKEETEPGPLVRPEEDRDVVNNAIRGRPDGESSDAWVFVTLDPAAQPPEPDGQEIGEIDCSLVQGEAMASELCAWESQRTTPMCACAKAEDCGETSGIVAVDSAAQVVNLRETCVDIDPEEVKKRTPTVPDNRQSSNTIEEANADCDEAAVQEYSDERDISHTAVKDEDESRESDTCSQDDGSCDIGRDEGDSSRISFDEPTQMSSVSGDEAGADQESRLSVGIDEYQNNHGAESNVADLELQRRNSERDKDDEVSQAINEAGFLDVFALKKTWQSENRTLKKMVNKYRERSRRAAQLQQLIAQLGRETSDMRRMLEALDRQTLALRNEAADMRCTLSAVCDSSVAGLTRETEARSLEPACYRRYTNIRTPLDAANLLSAIRSRIKALGELEILVYRKQLVLHHVLPSSAQERTPGSKRVTRAIHKGQKPKKNEESTNKKGNIVIEVVSPSPEPGLATPSWSDEVTNTESPITISAPFSVSVDGETPPLYLPDSSDV